MGYYTRVLSKRSDCPSYEDLKAHLKATRSDVVLSLEDGEPQQWTSLLLSHVNGPEIAAIERNPVVEGALGSDELEEFIERVPTCRPESAANWLVAFLKDVKAIYAFQHLSGTERAGGDEALATVREAVWAQGDAIIQADGEGFSNQDGYHILWQFSDRATGPWWMAVLQNGRWVPFQMELGNRDHRKAFLEGRVPAGVKTR